MNCSFCKKQCKNSNSLRNHERLCKLNPDYIPPPSKTDAWYKAMREMRENNRHSNGALRAKKLGVPYVVSEETRKKVSEFMKIRNSQYWTLETRFKHSQIMREAVFKHPDSYCKNNVVGRVKNIAYKDTNLKGSWEVVVANALDKENIKWTNDITPFNYFFENKWRLYFPDFYLPDYDLYIEVKGYERERDRAKWLVVNRLLVIKAAQIKALKQNAQISQYIIDF